MKDSDLSTISAWSHELGNRTLIQVMQLAAEVTSLTFVMSRDGDSFETVRDEMNGSRGVLSITGRFHQNNSISLVVEISRGQRGGRIDPFTLFHHLSNLGEGCRPLPPEETGENEASLLVEIGVDAQLMSFARAQRFLGTLKKLDRLAGELQDAFCYRAVEADLTRLYQPVSDILKPIVPGTFTFGPNLMQWARDTHDLLAGSSCVAVSAPSRIRRLLGLAVLAECAGEFNTSLGLLQVPGIHPAKLLAVLDKAPGIVVAPAVTLNVGTNSYEMANEVRSLLDSVAFSDKAVIVTGSFEQLQEVFHGGQGGTCDPLVPVVVRVPEVPEAVLIRFSIKQALLGPHGIGSETEQKLCRDIADSLNDLPLAQKERLLPAVANRTVKVWSLGKHGNKPPISPYTVRLAALHETLAGLTHKPRAQRSPEVQSRFGQALTDPGLLGYLQSQLLAQDQALKQLVDRLRTECLTRPLHQPLRYCAQGTPGTGKSESAALLARRMRIPLVNIDAASMPDYHVASAQLLGSGRGFVGSQQSGRLEQIAKHTTGVLVEISDLDHAVPTVRAALADLFLQLLETGEAQSATGAMFSCANLIFAFTMNLPEGMDEAVRKGVGFNGAPNKIEIGRRVTAEIKRMLSSAFLSRVGTPIIFEPLDGAELAQIVERSVRQALTAAANRLRMSVTEIVVEPDVGSRLVAAMETPLTSFGARALIEHGRSVAAEALMGLSVHIASPSGQTLRVRVDDKENIALTLE